jgi:hypothetical protein
MPVEGISFVDIPLLYQFYDLSHLGMHTNKSIQLILPRAEWIVGNFP